MDVSTQKRLDKLAVEINREHSKVEKYMSQAVTHAIAAGERLIEAKSLVKHGEWLPWLKSNFGGSESIAQFYMQLARNPEHVRDLKTIREALKVTREINAAKKQRSKSIGVRLNERGETPEQIVARVRSYKPPKDKPVIPDPGPPAPTVVLRIGGLIGFMDPRIWSLMEGHYLDDMPELDLPMIEDTIDFLEEFLENLKAEYRHYRKSKMQVINGDKS